MKKNRVVVELDGGLVQRVYADDPRALRVVVADTDIDGVDPQDSKLGTVKEQGQRSYRAFLTEHDVSKGEQDLVAVYRALEQM